MADHIANQLNRMNQDIDSLNTIILQLETLSSQTAEELESLHTMWSGPAHTILIVQLRKDRLLMEQHIAMLKNFQEELSFARTTFSNCENAVGEAVASFSI